MKVKDFNQLINESIEFPNISLVKITSERITKRKLDMFFEIYPNDNITESFFVHIIGPVEDEVFSTNGSILNYVKDPNYTDQQSTKMFFRNNKEEITKAIYSEIKKMDKVGIDYFKE